MKNTFVFLIIVFASLFTDINAIGEELNIDQLIKQAETQRLNDFSKLKQTLQLLDSVRNKMNSEQKAMSNYLRGYSIGYGGKTDQAILYYQKALTQTESIDLKYKLYYSLANVYAIERNWLQGLIQLEKMAKLNVQVINKDLLTKGVLVTALFYNQLGQYQQALSYIDSISNKNFSTKSTCILHQLQIEARVKLKQMKSTNDDFKHWSEFCESHGEYLISGFIKLHFIQTLLAESKYQQVSNYITTTYTEITATGYKRLIAEVASNRAIAAFQLSQPKQAYEYANLSIENSKGTQYSMPLINAYDTLYQLSVQEKDYKQALFLQQKKIAIEKGYLNDQSTKQIAYQRAKLEVLEKNYKIKSLSQANNLLQLTDRLTKETAKNTRLFVYLMIFVVATLVLWTYNLKRNQKRLRTLAEFDGLTGLNNRRHFTESAENLLKYCNSEGQYASFIMFDLDKFKVINDTYGHLVGDWVLKETAKVVKAQGRKHDLIGRVGGEEFAIILPSCDILQGKNFAEQCRKAIESIDTSECGHQLKISASFGLTFSEISGFKFKQLMHDSDLAMYQAKETGRNKVIVWEPTKENS